jgi:hypothetical protein
MTITWPACLSNLQKQYRTMYYDSVATGAIDKFHKQLRLAVFVLNEIILLHVSLCPNLNTVYHFAFKL